MAPPDPDVVRTVSIVVADVIMLMAMMIMVLLLLLADLQCYCCLMSDLEYRNYWKLTINH